MFDIFSLIILSVSGTETEHFKSTVSSVFVFVFFLYLPMALTSYKPRGKIRRKKLGMGGSSPKL